MKKSTDRFFKYKNLKNKSVHRLHSKEGDTKRVKPYSVVQD